MTTRRSPNPLSALLLCWLACGGEAASQQSAGNAETGAAQLKLLRQAIAERDENLARQEKAWPTREADQAAEAPTPLAVRELQAAQRELDMDIRETTRRLEQAAADDAGPLFDALVGADSPALVEVLAPLVIETARSDPRTFDALAAAAGRIRPPPLSVVRALQTLGTERADALLLKLGKAAGDATLLRAAASAGSTTVIATLIEWADGEDKALARASLRALEGLEPPAARAGAVSQGPAPSATAQPRDPGEAALDALRQKQASINPRVDLKLLVTREILGTRPIDIRVALLGYLALFKDESLMAFLNAFYRDERSEPLRIAAISALGRLGDRSADLLLAELTSRTNSVNVRRACALSLGAVRYKPAVQELIACLEEPELEADALRALNGIAGRKVGKRQSDWIRWWRVQPECKPEDRDPEQE